MLNRSSNRLYKAINAILFFSPKVFFPTEQPEARLREDNQLAIALNQLIVQLPQLLKEKQLRKEVDNLNANFKKNPSYLFAKLIANSRQSPRQVQTALTILLVLAQAYLHEDPKNPCQTIPMVLSCHINKLCKMMKRPPILTYSDYVLYNWRLIDPAKAFALNNVEPLFTLTGSDDEKWFIKIHIMIEAIFNDAINLAQKAQELAARMDINTVIKNNLSSQNNGMILNHKIKPKLIKPHRESQNEKDLTNLLNKIANIIHEAILVMKNMYSGLDINYFFDEYRYFLKGFDHIFETTGKPVKFENEKFVPLHYTGASGAQSSVLPALDGLLGIEHKTNLQSFRGYMPIEHQQIIAHLEKSSLAKVVSDSKSEALKRSYDFCRNALTTFRLQHFALVKQYILEPAKQKGIKVSEIKGTGGEAVEKTLTSRTEATMPRARL